MNNILVDSLIHKLMFHPKYWWIRHSLFWIFIYLDEFLSLFGLTEAYDDYLGQFFSFSLDVTLVYFNLLFLYPRFLKKRRIGEYALYTAISVALLFVCEYLIDIFYWGDPSISIEYFVGVFTSTAVVLTSAIAIKILKDNIIQIQKREEAENQKLTVELDALKKQVNPHFLFNVLNGIYIQSQTDHEKVPDTIMQLSDLLRYQIYDAEKNDKISISKEIDFIHNYVALEQMRREDVEVNFTKDIENPMYALEPLLIIPLIENAFKYSVAKVNQQSKIDISISQKGGSFEIIVNNNIGILPTKKEGEGGLGLTNLRQRLAHLYPERHSLEVDTSKGGTFSVKLEIHADEMHNSR